MQYEPAHNFVHQWAVVNFSERESTAGSFAGYAYLGLNRPSDQIGGMESCPSTSVRRIIKERSLVTFTRTPVASGDNARVDVVLESSADFAKD